ncbi:hypothetical protein SKUN_001052 [Spiroplasma kunkelii CR2-3x]|uniref:Uncharacterized protein n=1 Tax=Spiroplasma kunkelii CR2-3x TaxID=273035 RepID=A0A0K2JHN4_SPIKU|nr:hypothetical protein [Spiroplasma kunkelii]ALA97938.1 hypothetical protein SKUN_001052 [Spiroplasma kunkelii CR2-3x]
MRIEFSPDIISLLEKANFYKSQTLTKINPDNYGFTNQYNNWFGKSDTNHKNRPIMLSEADAKYVWKKSMLTSNNLSIIPWSSTEKSGIWQIEISQQLLENFINNYIKNISIKLDNKSIVYNSNNELSVPFDNDTILSKDWELKITIEIAQKIIERIGNKIRWEPVPIPSFTTDSAKYIDIPEFSEKYRYQVWL